MKKKLVLSAMLVALLALGLTVTGCPTEDDDDDGGGGGGGGKGVNATISMADLGSNSFTLTLAGARWKPEDDINFGLVLGNGYMNSADWGSGSYLGNTLVNLTVTRTSDTVLTIDVQKKQSYTGTGTIILKDNAYWADIAGNANTNGQYFLWYMTQDGFRDEDTCYGTVTVAEGSATSVPITIN
ncbi:MAG: hypothetical protein LBL70_01875 [Treponema sp.]|jgi:hypothetical protein|nr:hypothetical protein [Treponema sp.]